MDYKKFNAIKKAHENSIKKLCPNIENKSGIYFYTREEYGFKFCYCGKSVKLVDRLVSHNMGHEQHIDLSIKKHKFWSKDNPTGWKISYKYFPENELDEREREYILKVHEKGYQLYNVEIGGTLGKTDIGERSAKKGYRDGIKQGEHNAQKFIAGLFEKHLDVKTKSDNPNAYQRKALEKFNDFLKGDEEECQ